MFTCPAIRVAKKLRKAMMDAESIIRIRKDVFHLNCKENID